MKGIIFRRTKDVMDPAFLLQYGNILYCECDPDSGNAKWYGNAHKGKKPVNIHPDDRKTWTDNIKECASDPFLIRLQGDDGAYYYWQCRLNRITDPADRAGVCGIFTDVDDLVNRSMHAEQQRDMYLSTVQLRTDLYYKIAMLDLNTGMCRCIKCATDELRYLGDNRQYNVDDMRTIVYNWWINATVEKLIHPMYRQKFLDRFSQDSLRQLIEDGGDSRSMIYQRRELDSDRYRYVRADFIVVPAESPDGVRDHIMLYICDIHDEFVSRQKYQEELEQALREAELANRTKSDFIEFMTRDLNAQIRVIGAIDKMAAQALESGNTDRAKSYMIRLERISADLMLTFEDIFNVSRLQTIERTMKIEEMELKDVAEDCEVYMNYLRREKNLSYMRAGSLSGRYYCDERWLRKCLFKVIENAVKYNVKGGSISVNIDKRTLADREGYDEFIFVVSDTGVGMTREQKEHLFEPFSMKKRQPQDISSGTGIGLTIARGIMEAMQGSIEVESEEGKGTRITLRFPLQRA